MERPKILIVEDDLFLTQIYKVKFEKENFNVKIVTDGVAAISAVKEFKPDIMLLDIIMPKKSGIEVLQEVGKNKTFPIIVLSNLGQESDVTKAIQLGADEYLIKSFTKIDDIVEKVWGFLNLEENS